MKPLVEHANGVIIFLAIIISVNLVFEVLVSVPKPFHLQSAHADSSLCVDFIPLNTTIRLTCGSATLSDLYLLIKKYRGAMGEFEGWLEKESNKIWILNSSLVIGNNSTFTINSSDTKWLKINSDGREPYSIKVYGSMTIDSIKLTSWDPEDNSYAEIDSFGQPPRAFITVKKEGHGTTNITNSELAYLGYGEIQSHGLSYYGGNNSILRNNNIHNLEMGFYSDGVEGVLIENNHIHHNKAYGLDPHSNTRNMLIRNNVVHDNGHIGIICSGHCRNITIENNEVHNNGGSGILLSMDMKNSVVRNNYIHDSEIGIGIAKSHNNQVYGNRVSYSNDGIKVIDNSSNNYIYGNTLESIRNYAILARGADVLNNTFHSNDLDNSEKAIRLINNTGSLFINNDPVDITSSGIKYSVEANSTLTLERTTFPFEVTIASDNSTNNIINVYDSNRIIVNDGGSEFTNFDTNIVPFASRVSNETVSIISYNDTIKT
jgi:mannuronan 5-epimerase